MQSLKTGYLRRNEVSAGLLPAIYLSFAFAVSDPIASQPLCNSLPVVLTSFLPAIFLSADMPHNTFDTAMPVKAPRVPVVPRRVAVERLDQWELVSLAAEGAFAQIYRARPAGGANEATYAIKRVKPEHADDARATRRLRREARVGREVTSAHLVPILTAHTDSAPTYLVMPWIEADTLSSRICASDISGDAFWISRQVAEALDALDRAGWTHADVKPDNILVAPSGHATLIDLGLARRPADQDRDLVGCLAGTPRYMAPEALLSGRSPDIRSDIYSLGAVLYEMLTGRPPYASVDTASLIAAQRHEEPVSLRVLAPHAPREAARLVHDMLSKEPLRRPQSPREVVHRLAALEILAFAA